MEKIPGGATIWARQTIESDIFLTKPDKWFKIWFYIVNKVKFMKNGRFERGENFIKYEWISDATGATKSQIDHFLRWAKEVEMLATRKATRGMVVNVLKYEVYQDLENYTSDEISELKAKQKRNKSDTILKNDKKEKNDKNVNPPGVQEIMNLFYEINPSLNFGSPFERKACTSMLAKWPLESVKAMAIQVIACQSEDRYAPRATTPSKMWTKIGEFQAYFKTKGSNKRKVAII